MGQIYCITFPSSKKYIGQTRQTLKQRINQHKCSNDSTLISRAFKKYETFEYEILCECNNKDLDVYEKYYIDKYNSIAPFGYNLRSGGQSGYYFTDIVRLKCSLNARKGSNQLLMYMYNFESGYRCRPPNRPEKYFNYKFLSKQLNCELAKEYVEGRNDLYNKYVLPKQMPKFISKVERPGRSGYRVTYPGYEKHFTSMKLTDDIKFDLANEYLNSVMEKVQRLNGNGEN